MVLGRERRWRVEREGRDVRVGFGVVFGGGTMAFSCVGSREREISPLEVAI